MINSKPKDQIKVNEPTKEQIAERKYVTVAIIKPMNVYDRSTGTYTAEINQKTVKVETFVDDLKTQKPVTIGYISVSTFERFLNGEIRGIPIKQRKD